VAAQPAARPNTTTRPAPRTIIVGLGNPLLTVDGVGVHVLEFLRPQLESRPDLELCVDDRGGLRLMERMIGFGRAIIIDAICSDAAPGTVRVFGLNDLPTRHSTSAHDASLADALELGRTCDAELPSPDQIRLVAIEAASVLDFGEQCTPRVAASIAPAAQVVLDLLTHWR
jgi:hydrogenase maturation protease